MVFYLGPSTSIYIGLVGIPTEAALTQLSEPQKYVKQWPEHKMLVGSRFGLVPKSVVSSYACLEASRIRFASGSTSANHGSAASEDRGYSRNALIEGYIL